MTKEEINKAVAEKVMGWTWLEIIGGWDPGSHILNDIKFKRDWNPAERWDHAGMVVDKWSYYKLEKIYGDKYVAILANDLTTPWIYGPWADTAPMAICFASLQAVKE